MRRLTPPFSSYSIMSYSNNKRARSPNDSETRSLPRYSTSSSFSHHINDRRRETRHVEAPSKDVVIAEQSTSLAVVPCIPEITPRSYQLEMYEESLKRNIIIAMDTGSGKTHVAVMRIKYELTCMSQPKLIWFLAPTISLCGQQHEYIKSQIASVQVKFLSGADSVDRWTEQSQWDDILRNVSVVVSTYQILLDALSHGFVQLQSLALIVFDEAHNCVGKHPGARIMNLFYHPRKCSGLTVPHILGLTASPVMGSKISSLIKIEQTLDSLSRTPTKTRLDLRERVKLPALIDIHFDPSVDDLGSPKTLQDLQKLFFNFEIMEDPYYQSLIGQTDFRSQQKFEKLVLNRKTWCFDQIKAFYNAADTVFEELGPWAANYYISEIVSRVSKPADNRQNDFDLWDESLEDHEKRYLKSLLQRIKIIPSTHFYASENMPLVSDKVAKMIGILSKQSDNFSGIIFVQERAVVTALSHLLRIHPLTCNRFRIGSIVGYSRHSKRSNMFDLLDSNSQNDALPDFKSGKTNLLIGTSVLEEGIDAPSCNLVLCFHRPSNLKSYVQRRGRARQQESQLILLVGSNSDDLNKFNELEQDMKAYYQDENRALGELTIPEEIEEIEASKHNRIFRVEKTGAVLDLDNAVSHLYHFCSTLPADKYVDTRPDFILSKDTEGLVRARVILPTSVNETVRTTDSLRLWQNEKNSVKDAAFETYKKLYKVGLISDNLLPLLRHFSLDDEFKSAVEVRPSIITVQQQMNPWCELATVWDQNPGTAFQSTISFNGLNLDFFMPILITNLPSFQVYWDSNTEIEISIPTSWIKKQIDPETWAQINEDTDALLNAARSNLLFTVPKGSQHVIKFKTSHPISLNSQLKQREAVPEDISPLHTPKLIRDHQDTPYIFRELLPQKPDIKDVQKPTGEFKHAPDDLPYLSLERLTRRRDFLNRPVPDPQPASIKPHYTVIPLNRCQIDVIPFKYFQFSLMVPSIMRRLELHLVAENLCKNLRPEVNFSDTSTVLMAICTGNSSEPFNYQRLEFLGDSVLKFCAAMEIMAANPMWHEGNLSIRKDHLVANSRLARAAVERGLDRYIITDKFADKKWHPMYVERVLHYPQDQKREMSTKVLADVVESLVGAAMLEGGIPKAISCLRFFLPEIKWESLESCRNLIYEQAATTSLPAGIKPIETMLGYTFQKPSLLIEALTHASYPSGSYSFERLEFIGDSILDHIVVQNMYPSNLPHIRMHDLRTALVNADLLAVISMELHHKREVIDLEATSEDSSYQRKIQFEKVPLYCFLRHNSPGISNAQKITAQYYCENRDKIQNAINSGTYYPWMALCSLGAEKFFSDMVEALLGAVWIDSGDLTVVEGVVERMGILKLLRRMVTEGVDVEHPKIKLGKLAVDKKVEYVVDRTEQTCSVLVGGKLVVTVEKGLSRLELETRAATEAVKCLEAEEKEKRQNDNLNDIGGVEIELDDVETGDMETGAESLNDMTDNHVDNISGEVDLIEFND